MLKLQYYKSLIRAPSRKLAVIVFGAPFLLLFWRSKKVKTEIFHKMQKYNTAPKFINLTTH